MPSFRRPVASLPKNLEVPIQPPSSHRTFPSLSTRHAWHSLTPLLPHIHKTYNTAMANGKGKNNGPASPHARNSSSPLPPAHPLPPRNRLDSLTHSITTPHTHTTQPWQTTRTQPWQTTRAITVPPFPRPGTLLRFLTRTRKRTRRSWSWKRGLRMHSTRRLAAAARWRRSLTEVRQDAEG